MNPPGQQLAPPDRPDPDRSSTASGPKARRLVVWGKHLHYFIPFYAWMAFWVTTFRDPGAGSLLVFLFGLPLWFLAMRGYKRVQQVLAPRADEVLASDSRPPVLYLRSFDEDPVTERWPRMNLNTWDVKTEEQHLAAALESIGPPVAVGLPGERLPDLGVSRMYVAEDEWQSTITALMTQAQVVIFRAAIRPGRGQGLMWEVRRAAELVPPERLLFVVPRDREKYEAFRQEARLHLGRELPEHQRPRSRSGTIAGLIYFTPEWSPCYVPLRYSMVWDNSARMVIGARIQQALRPFFEQTRISVRRPRISASRTASAILVCLILLVLVLLVLGSVVSSGV